MSKHRHRSRRPKGQKKRRILNSVKEEVIQLKAMGLKYNDICDKTNLGYSTVEHIVTKWAPNNPDRVLKARAAAMEALAERVSEKALLAIESMTPDSMTHDRVEQLDKEGNVVSVQHSGPTGPQLAVMAGILVDKQIILTDKASQLRGEGPELLNPTDFAALMASITERVTRLTEVKADFDTGAIQARIIELKEQVQDDQSLEADFEVLEEK